MLLLMTDRLRFAPKPNAALQPVERVLPTMQIEVEIGHSVGLGLVC